jgi:Predicted membrane-associated Zn-dependent proteases 1
MSILLFLIVLVALILVHEWGHFVTAKWLGMRADEFGIGVSAEAVLQSDGEKPSTRSTRSRSGGFVRIFW